MFTFRSQIDERRRGLTTLNKILDKRARVDYGSLVQVQPTQDLSCDRWNPNDVSVDEAIAAGILYIYEASKDISVQRNGGIFVMDADGIEFSHVKQISFDVYKKLNCLLNVMPLKFVGCVIMNSRQVMERLFNILKFAIRARNRKLIHVVHKNSTPLHDMVPDKELLPIYLGGEIEDESGFLQGVEEAVMRDTTLPSLVTNIQNECKMLDAR